MAISSKKKHKPQVNKYYPTQDKIDLIVTKYRL